MVLVAPLLLASVAHTIAGPPAIPTCVPALANGSCAAAVCCAVCADSSDCTTSMQAALDSTVAHTVVFHERTWVTQPLHITRNDTRLMFAPGALVLAKAGSFAATYDCLFACYLTRNLTISGYGATWRMRRSDYNDSTKYTPSVSPSHQTRTAVLRGICVLTRCGGLSGCKARAEHDGLQGYDCRGCTHRAHRWRRHFCVEWSPLQGSQTPGVATTVP